MEIKQWEYERELAEKIAVELLDDGMMQGKTEGTIKNKIKPFTDPTITLSHGRQIGIQTAMSCGLAIEEIPLDSDLWKLVYEIYIRSDWLVTRKALKLYESKNSHIEIPIPSEYTQG